MNVRANIPRPKIMKLNPRTLGKTARSLVVPKFTADNNMNQQEKVVTAARISCQNY
jgi:hypothetical protein